MAGGGGGKYSYGSGGGGGSFIDKHRATNYGAEAGGNTDFADGVVLLEAPCPVGNVLKHDICVDINACEEVSSWLEMTVAIGVVR